MQKFWSGAGAASGRGVDSCRRARRADGDQRDCGGHSHSGIADGADHSRPLETSERRRQANRDKRIAKKRRVQEEREELNRLRAGAPRKIQGESKGSGKGKSKDQAGSALCYSWGSGKGPCADVPVGGECKCPVKRVHKCQFCLSPAHKNADCPSR